MKIYLAHSITNSRLPGIFFSWKELFINDLKRRGVEVLDPMRYGLDNTTDYEEIIARNRRDIRDSEVVVAISTSPSHGVMAEMIYALRDLGKYVAVLGPPVEVSPYIRHYSTHVFHDSFKLIEWLTSLKRHPA